MMRTCAVLLSLALASTLVAGCGDSSSTSPTAPVTGVVTYKGAPLPSVNVIFEPSSGRPARGTTDAEGKFTLSTFGSGDGAVPGKHKVAITSQEVPPMPGTPGSENPQKLPYPERYRSIATSGLEEEVTAGQDNHFEIKLVDAPPGKS